MIEVSEKPAGSSASSDAGAPDWGLVPFEVACARCGHDLRGQSEPRCPACGLEFEWSEALPLEDLKCPGCEYRLVGLKDLRCPECGRPFTWVNVLAAAVRRRLPLFEYQWRTRPIRSLLTSWLRALWPRFLWGQLNIHDHPRPWPMLAMVVIALSLFSVLLITHEATREWIRWLLVRRGMPWRMPWPMLLRWTAAREFCGGLLGLVLTWALASLGALMIFRWSMKRCNFRPIQVVRVWAYAVTAPPLALAVVAWLILVLTMPDLVPRSWLLVEPWHVFTCCAIGIGHTTWSLRQGYLRYLRMPHAAAVAIVSQTVAVLAGLVIWDFALGGDAGRLIYWLLTGLLGRLWTG